MERHHARCSKLPHIEAAMPSAITQDSSVSMEKQPLQSKQQYLDIPGCKMDFKRETAGVSGLHPPAARACRQASGSVSSGRVTQPPMKRPQASYEADLVNISSGGIHLQRHNPRRRFGLGIAKAVPAVCAPSRREHTPGLAGACGFLGAERLGVVSSAAENLPHVLGLQGGPEGTEEGVRLGAFAATAPGSHLEFIRKVQNFHHELGDGCTRSWRGPVAHAAHALLGE